MRRLYELHASATRELGYDPLPITTAVHRRLSMSRSLVSHMRIRR
jgi:hypothetical protein